MNAGTLFDIFFWLWIGCTFLYLASHKVDALHDCKDHFDWFRTFFLGGTTFYCLLVWFFQ